MKNILILIPDLRSGGAERVLVNLANNFNSPKYNLTLMTLFNVGTNKKLLSSKVQYRYWLDFRIRGIWRIFKYIPAPLLHKFLIRQKYDIEIAYLEGISTKIISGANNSILKIAWLHCELKNNEKYFFELYKNINEFRNVYSKFNKIVGVSSDVLNSFTGYLPENVYKEVIHNVLDTNLIDAKAQEVSPLNYNTDNLNFITVGRLVEQKGYMRLLRIFNRLKEDYSNIHLYILGTGKEFNILKEYIETHELKNVDLLGYVENPYCIIKNMDCYICSSFQEGYSTAISEALYLGVPVISTNCSGCIELCDNNAGIISENTEEDLEISIRTYIEKPHIRQNLKLGALQKKKFFSVDRSIYDFLGLIETL